MSEDPSQLPGYPGAPEPPLAAPATRLPALPEQPEAAQPSVSAPQEQPAAPKSADQPQYPPTPEVYIQPAEVATPAQPQYPPVPSGYTPPQPASQDPATGYGAPPAGYNVPPAGYGAPAFPPPPGYGYVPQSDFPQARPLPLGQAIRELASQYLKILRKPGARSFAAEQGKAEWGIIWMQILFLVVLEAITALPLGIMEGNLFNSLNTMEPAGATPFPTTVFIPAITIGVVVLAPISLFLIVGVQYLTARAFKGTGSFKQQMYNQLLFQVPTTFIIAALYLIMTPFLSSFMAFSSPGQFSNFNPLAFIVVMLVGLVAWGVSIYSVILNVFAIMAAHRISGGRGTGAVLIPYGVLLVLYFGCVCAVFLVAASTIH